MDLSFTRFDKDVSVAALPTDLAVLMVGVTARQAASPTARVQARVSAIGPLRGWLCPLDGAFCGLVAAALTRWKRA